MINIIFLDDNGDVLYEKRHKLETDKRFPIFSIIFNETNIAQQSLEQTSNNDFSRVKITVSHLDGAKEYFSMGKSDFINRINTSPNNP